MPLVNPFTGRSAMLGYGEQNLGQYNVPFQTGYAHGAAMMVPRRVLDFVGPLAEDYFLYYEEIDWCERIRQAGLSVWVVPEALVLHKESVTMNTLGATKTYYLSRNRVLFMRRHYGGWSYLLFICFLFWVSLPKNTLQYFVKMDWKNLKAFLNGIFWNFNPKTAWS
jgi:GT2 family glycosyltransferase